MKCFALDEIAFHRTIEGRAFPFELCWKARACPIRICVGFEIAYVSNRLVFVDGTKARKRKIPPFTVTFRPVKRRLPALFAYSHPTE